MCNQVDEATVERAVGSFDKRGDGQVQKFPILVGVCICDETTYWARVPGGIMWVEAVPETEGRFPTEAEIKEFQQEVTDVAAARV